MGATETLATAKRPEDIFGELDGDRDQQLAAARREYRRLAREVHPDVNGDPAATTAFSQLSKLFDAAKRAILAGTYGTARAPVVDPVMITTRRRAFRVTQLVAQGDSCNLYACTYEHEGVEHDGLVKVARDRRDNDLVQNEARALKELLTDPATFDEISPYLPAYLEAFGYRAPGERKPRQAVAYRAVPNLYTLEQVRERYPGGVHPKDMAWMFRRLLWALGMVGQSEYVHGAVLPSHVLIEPEQHGVVLIDWKYATKAGTRIKAISRAYRDWYPPEVLAKEAALPGTDIFMAVRCMVYLLGGDPTTGALPVHEGQRGLERIRAFFRGSTLARVKERPDDAHGLLVEFDELIERLWGPRRFRPFAM